MADDLNNPEHPYTEPVAEEDHPLLLVIARAVYEHVDEKHKAAIVKALAQHGRGPEFLEPKHEDEPEAEQS